MSPENPVLPSQESIDLNSLRARKARHAQRLTRNTINLLSIIGWLCVTGGVLSLLLDVAHLPGLLLAVGIALLIYVTWWRRDIHPLPVTDASNLTNRLSRSILARLKPGRPITPLSLWEDLNPQWQARFIANRFFLPRDIVTSWLTDNSHETASVLATATRLADKDGLKQIEVAHIIGALLLESPTALAMFKQARLRQDDIVSVVDWLIRSISMLSDDKPDYGGIGRDWTHGYTPSLDHYGHNVSLDIERHGGHYSWLSQSANVQAMKNAFAQGASGIALVGKSGIGKTSHVYALAQLLLQENKIRNLEHRQIISLSASAIIANAGHPGRLEAIMNRLLLEANHAGHIMLFLDDAQVFFNEGVGAFDASQLLQPVLQSRSIQLIVALTPEDFQRLKSRRPTFANLLTPVILQEMPETSIMRILEDTTLGLEHSKKVLITYDALREAYRLSGRYEQEIAYPGKAINLLEQSLSHASDGIVTAESVQRAIEQTRGVKVTQASSSESDTLLNLESRIHQRMINQTRAVSAVSNALRRARAGVANPKRPIGSFLFLGPTGVGKTELAKAISHVYFGEDAKMVRLDMSEYQQASDVTRLLSDGAEDSSSLIMSVRQQPFGVVLLDEIEKAHPNILNLLLQLLDEGQLTDNGGRAASFKDCVVIVTSNAGADTIRQRVEQGESLESFEAEFTDQLINTGQFKPELLNRFDEIVLFRPLTMDELAQVVGLMVAEINQTLSPQNISIELTPEAVSRIVSAGYSPLLGARPMRRTLQRAVEDIVAQRILRGEASPGDHLILDTKDLSLPN